MIKPNEIKLKRPQWDVFTAKERYRLLVAGRRFGKTFLALVELCRAAWAKDRLVWYVAPTYKQGKRIAWEPLKKMTKPYWAAIGQQDGIFTTRVLKEMMLPDSRTPAACEAFLAHTKEWYSVSREPLQVRIYGDATGSGRKTAASQTDWQIVREFFNRHRDLFTASFQLRSSNPEVKDRVACVNSRLRNQAGERHIEIDPRCQQLIADLEQVHWRTDASGNSLSEIDKSDPKRTHLSDAFGYMIEKEFPMKPRAGERSGYVA
jgi:hypothetical protein